VLDVNEWVIGTVGDYAINKGNLLIDGGFRIAWQIAGLPKLQEKSIFSNEIIKYKRIISVGATSLCANTGNAGFLYNLDCKIIMVGGSLWNNCSTIIAKKCVEPIGVRDPFTYCFLRNEGYIVKLIGCPVVFIQPGVLTEDYLLVSLPRSNPEDLLKTIVSEYKGELIKGVCHEQSETKIFKKFNIDIIEDMKQAYGSAKKIITGRLHGAILGKSWGKDVTYIYDKFDGRNSLFEIDFINLKKQYLSFLSNLYGRL